MTFRNVKFYLLTLLFLLVGVVNGMAQQEGKASYYGKRFHGRKTSSGALFDMHQLTCAHRTLPFGTQLLVRNLSNNKEVIVTVTDRGPYYGKRIIDLSYAAAKEIGMIKSGVAKVLISKYVPRKELVFEKLTGYSLTHPTTEKVDRLGDWKRMGQGIYPLNVEKVIAQRPSKTSSQPHKSSPRWVILNEQLTAKAELNR